MTVLESLFWGKMTFCETNLISPNEKHLIWICMYVKYHTHTHTNKLFLKSKLYKVYSVLQMGASYCFLTILIFVNKNGCDF